MIFTVKIMILYRLRYRTVIVPLPLQTVALPLTYRLNVTYRNRYLKKNLNNLRLGKVITP